MDKLQKRIIEAVRKDSIFDLLANEGHTMSKDTLRRVAMELAYGLHNVSNYDKELGDRMRQGVGNELLEWWGDDEETEDE